MGTITVAVTGVGNRTASLVQGSSCCQNVQPGVDIPEPLHVDPGRYRICDRNVTAAFDIDVNKVGKDRSDVVVAPPNTTYHGRTAPSAPFMKPPRQHTDDQVPRMVAEFIAG